jgi:co-chaperonin GroES (HSP10)
MRVKPFTGQVLIALDGRQTQSPYGIALPEHTLSPEEQQELDHHPTPPGPLTGTVREIGPWPKLKNGMAVMPPFGVGARVLIPRYGGIEMHMDVYGRFKMVMLEDVLALLI